MAVTKQPEQYKTSDGSTFDNQAEAEAHEKLLTLKRDYESVRKKYEQALAQTCKTADGKPFSFDRWTYWKIMGFMSLPQLARFNPSRWTDIELEHNGKKTEVIFHEDNREERGCIRRSDYRISELYAEESAARKALLKRQKEWLAEQQEMIDKAK